MLTREQLLVLKADIAGDPVFGLMEKTVANACTIAAAYNQPASPAWWLWRTAVTAAEWRQAIIGGGGATQLDGLTGSKREALLWACSDTLDPSVPAIRAALDDFCGSQNNLKAAIIAAQKRTGTRAEKLFSAGTGSEAAPATFGWEGTLSYGDVQDAWNMS